MSLPEKLRSPAVDPIAGWAFLAVESINIFWLVVEQALRASHLPENYRRYETPLWASIANDLLTVPLLIVIGLGLARGRAWALWIQGLISFRIAFDEVVRPSGLSLNPHVITSFCLSVAIFVYAGLRILGVIGDGPRPLFRKVVPAD